MSVKRTAEQKKILLSLLHQEQDRFGYIPKERLVAIEKKTSIPRIKIEEAITFYDFFRMHPAGKHTIRVCSSVSCKLQGGDQLVRSLENLLGVRVGEVTDDGLWSLERASCLGR